MKKLFAIIILALIVATPCVADCEPPIPGQQSSPPCTGGAAYLDTDESTITTGVDAAASDDTSLNALCSDLFIDSAKSILLAVW